jgi:hypothetical protein
MVGWAALINSVLCLASSMPMISLTHHPKRQTVMASWRRKAISGKRTKDVEQVLGRFWVEGTDWCWNWPRSMAEAKESFRPLRL